MVPVARKNLLAEKTRFVVAVGGVAFAVFLVVVVMAVYLDARKGFTAVIDNTPADHAKGRDMQIEKAVEVLKAEIAARAKR